MKDDCPDKPVKLMSSQEGDLDLYFQYYLGTHRPPMVQHAEKGWHPPADLYETETEVVIRIDIAGIELTEASLVLDKDHLHLSGIRQEPVGPDKRQYHKIEVPYGPFERSFRLPSHVCAAGAKATYSKGFLTIRLEKRSKPVSRKVTIKIG